MIFFKKTEEEKARIEDAKRERVIKLKEMKKAKEKAAFQAKLEAIKNRPEIAEKRRQKIKERAGRIAKDLGKKAKQLAEESAKQKPNKSMNGMGFGGKSGFGNPMAEFSRPMKKRKVSNFGGSGFSFGDPMAEFSKTKKGKKKKQFDIMNPGGF